MMAKRVGFVVVIAAALWALWDAPPPGVHDFEANDRKVLLLALEGGDWNLLDPMLPRLPNFQELRRRAVMVPISRRQAGPTAVGMHPSKTWTTISTGASPRPPEGSEETGHGIVLTPFRPRGHYHEVPVTSLHRQAQNLWEVLSGYGVKCAVTGWWATWPAEAVNGQLVSQRFFLDHFDLGPFGSRGHPDVGPVTDSYRQGAGSLTYPEALNDELAAALKGRVADPGDPFVAELRGKDGENAELKRALDMLENALVQDLTVAESAAWLLDREPDTQFVATYFGALDVAGHLFWKYLDAKAWTDNPALKGQLDPALVPIYKDYLLKTAISLDGALGRILSRMGDDTTVVMVSGHGLAPNPSQTERSNNLNPLFERLGFLARHPDGTVDYSKTKVFDSPLDPWQIFRRIAMNFEGDYPEGFVGAGSDEERAKEWNEVRAVLRQVEVRPAWNLPPAPGQPPQRFNGLFGFEGEIPWEMQYGVCNVMTSATQIVLPDGRFVAADELFPPKNQSGRHREGGFLGIAYPGADGEWAGGQKPPLGKEIAFQLSIAPTVLALFGLPHANDGNPETREPEPLYWMLPRQEGQMAAIREVASFEGIHGRLDPSTPEGRRHSELREQLEAVGYLEPTAE